MIKKFSSLFVVMGFAFAADPSFAQETTVALNQNTKADSSESAAMKIPEKPSLTKAEGMVMLDYEVIPVPGSKSIDLMGFHFLNKMNDWLYLGVGGYAPVFKGEYGGFMAFDVTAHAQRKIFGDLFADAGVSLGGGGGGKSVQQSKILSGTGGFVKTYIGLGYDFKDFTLGANVAHMKFTNSAIDHSQVNAYVQIPFSYTIGPYASSGDRLFSANSQGAQGIFGESSENMLTLGLDNFAQIDPEGTNKNKINVADLQFSHFMTQNSYWFFNLGVGYHGLPLYNEILGGLGYRFQLSPRISIYSQLGLGSGGYAPETINTGPGFLVYPKVSAEYMLDKNFGLALTAGYLFAPKGSSKNYTFGAALNYHIQSGDSGMGAGGGSEGLLYRGYRFNLYQQTELDVKFRGQARGNINLLSVQADNIVNDNLYIPIQAGVAYNAYLGYPGYGELLAGVGVQNKYSKEDRFQLFGQLLVGTNVHGPIVKPGIGVNFGLSDRLAIYGLAGQTIGVDKDKFKSNYVGLGLTYRFSVPSR